MGCGRFRVACLAYGDSRRCFIGETLRHVLDDWPCFFGGGFALVPVLHQTLVEKLGWLSPQEFIDGVAISNLTPGPISVLATFAGYRLRGIAGALEACGAPY